MTASLLNYSSIVPPLTNQPTNTVVLSAPLSVVGPISVSTTQAGVSFYANGANRGQAASYGGTTAVQVQVTTSSAYNTAVHAIITVNGFQYSFSAVTAADFTVTGSQNPLQFSLTDANTITRNTAHTTNAVAVIATTAALAIPVSVPNLFGAKLIKNGVALGTTVTTAVLGDQIAVVLTAPSQYSASIQIPLFIGNTYDTFFAVTNAPKDIPTGFTFTNVVGAAFNTPVASNNVIVAGLDTNATVSVTVSAGATLFKNGVALVSQTATVLNGDLIRVSVTSASDPNYDTTTYVSVSVGATFKTYWSVTTKSSTDLWVKNSLQGKALYDLGAGGLNAFSTSFNGTTDYLTVSANAALALGTGDFTVETWVYFNSLAGAYVPICQSDVLGSSSTNKWFFAVHGNTLNFGTHNSGAYNVSVPWVPVTGTWYHVAAVRSSGVTSLFVNGIASVATGAATGNGYTLSQAGVVLGTMSTPFFLSGKLSNFRIIKGTALYVSNFTPSPTFLTAVPGTSLLTVLDGTKTDYSGLAITVTPTGNPALSIDSPFNPAKAALNQNNSIYKIDVSTYGITSATSLYNPSVGTDASLSTFIHSMSYYEGITYKLNLAGAVVGSSANPAGYTVYDECYAPKYVMSTAQIATRRFVTLYNGALGLLRDTSGTNADISFGALAPYGTDSDITGSAVYVSMSNNTLAKIVLSGSTYVLSKYISLGGSTLGGLRQVVVDNANKVWVVDVYNSRVVVVNSADTIVANISLPNCDPWDICVDNGMNSWVACSFSNALARISYSYAVTYIQCSGVPSCVAVDKTNGNVWVGHYGSNLIDIFDPNTLALLRQISMPHPVSALSYDGAGGIWAQCLYSDLATQQNRLNAITPIDAVSFTSSLDVPVSTAAVSNAVTVSGLAKSITVSVPSNLNLSIAVTGSAFNVTSTSAVVNNGATVTLTENPVSSKYYTTNALPLLQAGSRSKTPWVTRTIGDAIPDPVYFDNVYDVPAGAYCNSASVPITGISPGVSITLTLDDPTWGIAVNGGSPVYGGPTTAGLGDTIQIVGSLSATIASLAYKSVNVLVDITTVVNSLPVVTPTVFGNFTVYSLYVDGQAPNIQKAPGRFVDMYYEQAVKKPHLSLSEATQEFESFTRRNFPSLVDAYTAEVGLSTSPAYADWFDAELGKANSPAYADWFEAELGKANSPAYADWFAAEIRQQTLVDFYVLKEFQYGTRIGLKAPQVTNSFEKGLSTDFTEGGHLSAYAKARENFPNFVDFEFDKPVLSSFREVGEREYSAGSLLSFLEIDVSYEYVPGRKMVEGERFYEQGQNLATALAEHIDPVLSVLSNQHFGDYEYIPYNNMGEKLADWVPPIPKVRGNAMYFTPTMDKGFTVKRFQKTFSMGFVRNTRHSEVLANTPNPMLTYVIGDSGGGPVDTQQHLYTTAALAIAAGTKAGYVNVRAYGFNTVVYKNGIAVPTKAYMYVVPVGVTSRNCLIDMPISNNVIPLKWYVQGG